MTEIKDDLISREALIKAIEQGEGVSWDSHGKDDLCVRKKYIDNALTVEPRDNFDLGYVKGLEDGRNEKPKVISDHFVSFTRTCHICGYSLATYNPEDYKFCPRCGMEF